MDENSKDKHPDRIRRTLYLVYLCYLLAAIVIVGRIVQIQLFYSPDESIAEYFHPRNIKETLKPTRGAILSCDGRLLAMSTPMYQVGIDATVRKNEFQNKKDPVKRRELEENWRAKARQLAAGLSEIYGDKSADEYYKLIIRNRENNRRYTAIGKPIDHDVLQKIKALPLFSEGANKGGIVINEMDTRQYPYGSLARRAIGYVKDNTRIGGTGTTNKGIEGNFDYYLHGEEGHKWMKRTDNNKYIQNYDSTFVAAVDGSDIRTTIDIDIQDIADKALRHQIEENVDIEGACAVILDVKTGAIRAMVNLMRDSTTNHLGETYNYAVQRPGEPGSVFKASTLMSLLEDKKVTLETTIPTNHGRLRNFPQDDYITRYEAREKSDKITILRGFELSSNYVFRKVAIDNYGSEPKTMMDKIYLYKLGEAFDFELDGLAAPTLPSPDSKWWSATDLGSVAIGYSVTETPLHIVTFYNAIANKGKMMKPYFVEDIERNGSVVEKRGPSVLNGSICSKATADTLARALRRVVVNGTGKNALEHARIEVAGKTGTARVVLDPKYTRKSRNPYQDEYGRKQYQATFVGFFPWDAPKYTCIVTAYTKLGHTLYGGSAPAFAFREIVDKIYSLKAENGEVISKKGVMPDMKNIPAPVADAGHVPDVRGLGVMDAVYELENAGYKVVWHGNGHVSRQDPASGTKYTEGNTVTLELK